MSPLNFEIEPDEVDIFLEDVADHLQAMESGLLRLEQTEDAETIDSVFRAAHTLKAVAATIGHQSMSNLAHAAEALFDHLRTNQLPLPLGAIDELLSVVDALRSLGDEVLTKQPSGVDNQAIIARLQALRGDAEVVDAVIEPAAVFARPRNLTPEQQAQAQTHLDAGEDVLIIDITTELHAFVPGARLLQAAMVLADSGTIIVQTPTQDELTADQHDSRLWVLLATSEDRVAIEEKLTNITGLEGVDLQPYVKAAFATANHPVPQSQSHEQHLQNTVRISVERLDTLVNLVGELVTNRTHLLQIETALRTAYANDKNVTALSEMAVHFTRVVDQLQQEVMQARMLPIATLFDKFPRLVRDLARASNKQVNLVIEGQATELDRSVIEMIGDPLIHLLRNAIDHGIESVEQRLMAGKPDSGTVRVAAAHEEGHIVITVQDDGQGIDPERMRQIAIERDLLSKEEAEQLDDEAAKALIFQPHLSTAQEVTELSGRGMGLDIVLTNIKQLSGSVVLETQPGIGTTFHVTLPLTLAILQAMLVGVGHEIYAIPLTSIIETLYLSDVMLNTIKGTPAIQWRGQVLPLVNMGYFFGENGTESIVQAQSRRAIVVVSWGKLRMGLIVDKLIGKQEIVIKSLSPIIGNIPGLSGCTILGDGQVVLIVDISGIINNAVQM